MICVCSASYYFPPVGTSAAANDFTDLLSRLQSVTPNQKYSKQSPTIQVRGTPSTRPGKSYSSSKTAKQSVNGTVEQPLLAQQPKSSPSKPSPSLAEAAQALSKLNLSSPISGTGSSTSGAGTSTPANLPFSAQKTSTPNKPHQNTPVVTNSPTVTTITTTTNRSPETPKSSGKKSSKRLAPSVAAIFDSASQQHQSDQSPKPQGRSHRKATASPASDGLQQQQQHPPAATPPGQRLPAHPIHRGPLLPHPLPLPSPLPHVPIRGNLC